MPCGNRSVWANITFVTFLALMGLSVHLVGVAIWKHFITSFAFQRFVRCVQFLYVDSQVGFPSTRCRTQFTLENGFIANAVDQFMSFQGIRLCKTRMANITFIWFLPCMNPQMSLQLEGIRGCVCAVWTLVRTLTGMASNVTLQLAQLNAGVITFRAFMRLFVGVPIPYVSYEFSRGSEAALTVFTMVGFMTCMSVYMVMERG